MVATNLKKEQNEINANVESDPNLFQSQIKTKIQQMTNIMTRLSLY